MNLETVIYHNPRCSKSRQTLALLEEKGIKPAVVEYLKVGLESAELERVIGLLGQDASIVLRKKEDAYGASGLTDKSTVKDIVAALVKEPILLERPIVVHGDRAALGRPPENILSILK